MDVRQIIKEFGSWGEALTQAGFADRMTSRARNEHLLDKLGERGALLELLRLAAGKVDGPLTIRAYQQVPGAVGTSRFTNEFGSWAQALTEAGLADRISTTPRTNNTPAAQEGGE